MDFEALLDRFRSLGCRYVLVKTLAKRHDSKNQVYLAKGDFAVLNALPFGEINTPSGGRQPWAPLNLIWIDEEGALYPARHAKLILYPQYPEIRLSGFLKGCDAPVAPLLDRNLAGRLLFLGVGSSSEVYAWACMPESEEAAGFRSLEEEGGLEKVGSMKSIPLGLIGQDRQALLLEGIRRVHERGWVRAEVLFADGTRKPIKPNAPNGAGLTYEAALGVSVNAVPGPDLLGFEMKTMRMRRLPAMAMAHVVTLITPSPSGGEIADLGLIDFMHRYGYPSKLGKPDRLDFGGRYFMGGEPHPDTGLALTMTGFQPGRDGKVGSLTNLRTGAIQLVTSKAVVAAAWPFAPFLKHWEEKHADAAFVGTLKRLRSDGGAEFRFDQLARIGRGTGFLLFLQAIADGRVYLDPGYNLTGLGTSSPKVKPRSQFRTRLADLPALYRRFLALDALTGKPYAES